ncbi:MAG: alpha/beta fold hydrolase [Rhodobacteraceae bacterium]|nr:alpha/beta fold hydrolase [Paracoccaceae bacterium]
MELAAADISSELTDFTNHDILHGQGQDLTPDTPLLELGILDSLSMVSLLAFIEERYGVKIAEEEIAPKHFSDLQAVTTLILTHTQNQEAGARPADELRQLVSLQQSYGLRSVEVETPGRRHHMLQSDGAEPMWLLLPALGNPSTSWAPVMRALSGEQRSVALDFGGFGLSEYKGEAPSYIDHVEATLAVLDQLTAAPVVLVASSAGAMVAVEIARRRPDKIHALVVTGFGLIADPDSWWRELRSLSVSPEKFMEAAYYSPPPLTPVLRRILAGVLARPAYYSFLDQGGLEAMRASFDDIQTPTLFVAGEADRIIGRQAVEDACARIDGACVSWIARCGHFPPVERPEPFLWYVRDFLQSL